MKVCTCLGALPAGSPPHLISHASKLPQNTSVCVSLHQLWCPGRLFKALIFIMLWVFLLFLRQLLPVGQRPFPRHWGMWSLPFLSGQRPIRLWSAAYIWWVWQPPRGLKSNCRGRSGACVVGAVSSAPFSISCFSCKPVWSARSTMSAGLSPSLGLSSG